MHCPNCFFTNPEKAKFCNECGFKLPNSPVKNDSDSSFQKKNKVNKTEGERKNATVLFSDLSGYTAMTESMDPEDVKNLMDDIFTKAGKIVEKYQGTVERFFGDEIMILFGVPKTHEDDPIRAIHTAIEIHKLVDKLSPEFEKKYQTPLSMHTGINSGLVITGDKYIGKGRHGLTGDTINLAKRLTGVATTGEIIIGENTFQKAEQTFDFKECDPVKVKGKVRLVKTYKVEGRIKKSKTNFNRQIFSEIVGRDKELNKLGLYVARAIDGTGSVVNIIGEAGIGKSRLIAELKKQEVIKRALLLEGRSISIGKNLSFHPIIDLLKQWSRVKEDDTQAEASNRLETAIRRVCGDETDEVFPFVATMMGMKLSLSGKHSRRIEGIEGEALEKLIRKNVRELLIRSSELIPIVIVMEDLHWADTTSLELLESLFRLARDYCIVFINVFRPGYWQGDDRKVETLSEWLPEVGFAEIAIKPLDKQTGEVLINNMLQVMGLPYAVKKQIVDRSGGNPFFIEEIVRSLIDEGAIVRTNGAFQATEKIDHVVIPTTINDVLTARIDRLEEQTRDLIKIASVIGRSFFERILKEVADSIEGVDERLAYLKDAQFIRDRMRMEELEYLFKHALAQEAAYESTLIQQRKALHLKVAQSIEKIFQARLHEFYGMLAFHYSKADDLEKAEEYMVKAGEEALHSSASSEALHYFQEALQFYLTKYGNDADPAKLANFEKKIAWALHNKGQWSEAVKYFDRVLKRWGAPLPKRGILGMVRLAWDILVMMKMIYLISPNSKKIPEDRDKELIELFYGAGTAFVFFDNTRQFQVAMAILRHITKFDLSKIPMVSGSWTSVASVFSLGGLSFKLSNRLLEVSQRYRVGEDIRDRMKYTCFSTIVYVCQGAWEKISVIDESLLNASLRIGDFWNTSMYLWFYGLVKVEQGEFRHLMNVVDKLDEIGETYDYAQAIIYARGMKVNHLIGTRSVHETMSEAEQGLSYSREIGNEVTEMMAMAKKAEVQQLAGDTKGAHNTALEASEIYGKYASAVVPPLIIPYIVSSFFVSVEQLKHAIRSESSSDVARIRKHVYKVGKAAVQNSKKYAPYRTKILRLMGEYYWLIRKQGKAIKWWDKAIKEGERLGARPDLSRTYFEVGKRLLEPHSKYKELNGINAKGYLEKAGILFKEMDLQRDMDDLRRVKC